VYVYHLDATEAREVKLDNIVWQKGEMLEHFFLSQYLGKLTCSSVTVTRLYYFTAQALEAAIKKANARELEKNIARLEAKDKAKRPKKGKKKAVVDSDEEYAPGSDVDSAPRDDSDCAND
jgi:hypothetical protein